MARIKQERLALRSKSVQEAEDIEADDTSLAFCAIIDGDSPYRGLQSSDGSVLSALFGRSAKMEVEFS